MIFSLRRSFLVTKNIRYHSPVEKIHGQHMSYNPLPTSVRVFQERQNPHVWAALSLDYARLLSFSLFSSPFKGTPLCPIQHCLNDQTQMNDGERGRERKRDTRKAVKLMLCHHCKCHQMLGSLEAKTHWTKEDESSPRIVYIFNNV